MFKSEGPITASDQDILGRTPFAWRLADTIARWEGRDSLVVGLYGSWGTGKSSVINLVGERMGQLEKARRPTVIEFNPWMVAGQEKLLLHFFEEVASQLELQNREASDKATALKLRKYAALLLAAPEHSEIRTILEPIAAVGGLFLLLLGYTLGITLSVRWGTAVFVIGLLLAIARMSGSMLNRVAAFFEMKATEAKKSIVAQKNEIVKALGERRGKLLIVIDDVDRLSGTEIEDMFRLVRVNSDFPNTVFLMAFDRLVVEKHFDDLEKGIVGRDYLEKIVQVNFDIPQTKTTRVERYLFAELDAVLGHLPASWNRYFDKERWENLYHSGFREYFTSLRNIKRYINSLSFNLSMVVNNGVLEANPIDFMAIECIRVFCPEFYQFMRRNKDLFAFVDSGSISDYSHRERQERARLLSDELNRLPEPHRERVRGIIDRTFSGVVGGIIYGEGWLLTWNQSLQARSPEFYDVYFSLAPGGDEEDVSQYDIEQVLLAVDDTERLDAVLASHLKRGTIRAILQRLLYFTAGDREIAEAHIPSVVLSLFNVSDSLPTETTGMFDVGAGMDVSRILYRFGKRIGDSAKFRSILLTATKVTTSLSGPVDYVSSETRRDETGKQYYTVSEDDVLLLQEACLARIKEFASCGNLVGRRDFVNVLYRWKEWDKTSSWAQFIDELSCTNDGLLGFLDKFVYDQASQTVGDHAVKSEQQFGFQNLSGLYDLQIAKSRINTIVVSDGTLCEAHRTTIDLFLAGVDQALSAFANSKTLPAVDESAAEGNE